jgi:hypothetical protein
MLAFTKRIKRKEKVVKDIRVPKQKQRDYVYTDTYTCTAALVYIVGIATSTVMYCSNKVQDKLNVPD